MEIKDMLPVVSSLVSSIDRLKDTYDKLREIEERKTIGISKPGDEEKAKNFENEKKMQLLSMTGLLVNQLSNLASSMQQSTTWQNMQQDPAARTMEIVENSARAGRPLSRQEISQLFQREASLGKQIADSVNEGEQITGLAPGNWTKTKQAYYQNSLYGAQALKEWIDAQSWLWNLVGKIPGMR